MKQEFPPLPISELLKRVREQRPDLSVVDIDGLKDRDSALEMLIRPVSAAGPERESSAPSTGVSTRSCFVCKSRESPTLALSTTRRR
jgi:hypothetical protein